MSKTYKNLQAMFESQEYKEYISLIRQGVEEGILEVVLPDSTVQPPFSLN